MNIKDIETTSHLSIHIQKHAGPVTICEGKGKDPDAHRSESERYLMGQAKS